MQTFLSEPTFRASAQALDSKRLNKQLLEGRQMLNALAGNQKGFVNHPATLMWKGHEHAFMSYLASVVIEMAERGIEYANNWRECLRIHGEKWYGDGRPTNGTPEWFTGESKQRIITTHRANLYLKDPDYYAHYAPEAIEYQQTLDTNPLEMVCCDKRRRVPGKTGLQPCGYYWPTHTT